MNYVRRFLRCCSTLVHFPPLSSRSFYSRTHHTDRYFLSSTSRKITIMRCLEISQVVMLVKNNIARRVAINRAEWPQKALSKKKRSRAPDGFIAAFRKLGKYKDPRHPGANSLAALAHFYKG
ncbi:hypothetical protein TNIN_151901 [Trichonephila inaurata madagascariensis]|uniref:Uncharacterized protein n=1 Tax=Trichonephila inaurata madagascariensis TaxID=2747483 RepID=A0A8X7CEE4_9ARAC|nr:hypothetical protein TNIN_151881 [Trichonephila inaurata madagascariensis]GFY68974.1 hypothetical protein TNIN_151901 [Trichonephila inaurata madagascariensis]